MTSTLGRRMRSVFKQFRIGMLLGLCLTSVPLLQAAETDPSKEVRGHDERLRQNMDRAWEVTWSRFYRDDTHLFYDYLTSYEAGKELGHLPTAEEVARQHPNDCGYGTGMEDCMISAGVMLSMIVDRYAVTKDPALEQRANEVVQGIRLCATAHGTNGFLARGVCHEDFQRVYINSSRDQYTHVAAALWHYARSPLCSDKAKQEIGQILSGIADRMTRNVTAENDYDSLRADGTRDTRGISRMWNVKGHEAARLPMIYAAAWEVTGNPSYRELWRKYIDQAVKQSQEVEQWQPTYAFLQMQISLELLLELEPDPTLKQQMREIIKAVAKRCADRAMAADKRGDGLDLTQIGTDWRTGDGISPGTTYRTIWYCIRESGEAALAQMVSDLPFSGPQQAILERAINRLNYDQVSSNGIFFLQASYWRFHARRSPISED